MPEAPAIDQTTGKRVRLRLDVRGCVQGVGFRPFVFDLARRHGLGGFVRNSLDGLAIEVEGVTAAITAFREQLSAETPDHAVIQEMIATDVPPHGEREFRIRASHKLGNVATRVSPDLATCVDCLDEIMDPRARRYRYPFTNCTRCGPRFTIVERLPYDRPNTSMRTFAMCVACRAEYENPSDRRFHAQPIACPACGPRLTLCDATGKAVAGDGGTLTEAADLIRDGLILAVKGLGGFHLIVDATNDAAVRRLRERKHRAAKPLAVMFPDIISTSEACVVTALERSVLESGMSPILLLGRRIESSLLSTHIAPGLNTIGAMLPYTPLHHLLMCELGFPVVATSGNLSEEPICTVNEEALRRLGGIADAFLVHDRHIVRPVDDSVVRIIDGKPTVLRAGRGYAPLTVNLGAEEVELLAVGGQLKNTVAVKKAESIILSQHIGDLNSVEASRQFDRVRADFTGFYGVKPERVVCDSHPDYHSTAKARMMNLPVVSIQHHYAHVLSCMAEHGLTDPVLGVAWDGTGYGSDGTVWGGEFLVATRHGYKRVGRLRPFPLPGNEQAAREPWRAALGLVWSMHGDLPEWFRSLEAGGNVDDDGMSNLVRLLKAGLNAPWTSSAGRLFDAVASIAGLRHRCDYEGQAAMELEALGESAPDYDGYNMRVQPGDEFFELDWAATIQSVVQDILHEVDIARIAGKFHGALASGIAAVAESTRIPEVALTGGCFQNALLTRLVRHELERRNMRVFTHETVPPNDGGLAVGQAYYLPED